MGCVPYIASAEDLRWPTVDSGFLEFQGEVTVDFLPGASLPRAQIFLCFGKNEIRILFIQPSDGEALTFPGGRPGERQVNSSYLVYRSSPAKIVGWSILESPSVDAPARTPVAMPEHVLVRNTTLSLKDVARTDLLALTLGLSPTLGISPNSDSGSNGAESKPGDIAKSTTRKIDGWTVVANPSPGTTVTEEYKVDAYESIGDLKLVSSASLRSHLLRENATAIVSLTQYKGRWRRLDAMPDWAKLPPDHSRVVTAVLRDDGAYHPVSGISEIWLGNDVAPAIPTRRAERLETESQNQVRQPVSSSSSNRFIYVSAIAIVFGGVVLTLLFIARKLKPAAHA